MNALDEIIVETLVAHSHWTSSANWPGSPNPGNWRNIRTHCKCRQLVLEPDVLSIHNRENAKGMVMLREHQAEMLRKAILHYLLTPDVHGRILEKVRSTLNSLFQEDEDTIPGIIDLGVGLEMALNQELG